MNMQARGGSDSVAPEITFRPGGLEDSRIAYRIFEDAIYDLSERLNVTGIAGGQDPEVRSKLWEWRRPLFEHLGKTAHAFWLAEEADRAVGYARSIVRDGVWELTEFFVLPQYQSSGVGRELLRRVMPADVVRHKVIIATIDVRAQARYLKLGTYARFPIVYFSREAEDVREPTDLEIVATSSVPDDLAALRQIDRQIVGHMHDEDHAWLLKEREGYLYFRGGNVVGYGYTGPYNGPFALLHETDFPAVLAHAERQAARNGRKFGVEAPLINHAAVDYLLRRGYQMDSFLVLFMSDTPFGQFDRYLFLSPPFFL